MLINGSPLQSGKIFQDWQRPRRVYLLHPSPLAIHSFGQRDLVESHKQDGQTIFLEHGGGGLFLHHPTRVSSLHSENKASGSGRARQKAEPTESSFLTLEFPRPVPSEELQIQMFSTKHKLGRTERAPVPQLTGLFLRLGTGRRFSGQERKRHI